MEEGREEVRPFEIRKKYCLSCEDNFYNGCNPYGIEECWHLKTAKLIWGKIIGIWQNPPYDHVKNVRRPNCWRQKGVAFLREEK